MTIFAVKNHTNNNITLMIVYYGLNTFNIYIYTLYIHSKFVFSKSSYWCMKEQESELYIMTLQNIINLIL